MSNAEQSETATLHAILRELPVGVWVAQVPGGELAFANDEFLSIMGMQARTDVAAGEYGYDLPYFARMVQAGAVDCLQADLSRCGGITEWQRVAAVAAANNLQLSGHCAPYLHLDAAAATPNLRHLEYFHDHVRIETTLFEGAPAPQPGGVLVPDPARAGHGLEFRADAADRFRIG